MKKTRRACAELQSRGKPQFWENAAKPVPGRSRGELRRLGNQSRNEGGTSIHELISTTLGFLFALRSELASLIDWFTSAPPSRSRGDH